LENYNLKNSVNSSYIDELKEKVLSGRDAYGIIKYSKGLTIDELKYFKKTCIEGIQAKKKLEYLNQAFVNNYFNMLGLNQ